MTGFFLPEGGELSALRNAYNLTQAPIGVFAQASAIVLFPTISLLAAQKDWPAFRNEIALGIRRILFLTVPTSLLMAVLAEPIIRLVFLGGQFTEADVPRAALGLRLYSLGTFAWSAQAVLGRGFFAMQDSKTPLSITKVMIATFAVLAFVLDATLGFRGLALAMSLVGTANVIWFLLALHRRVGGLDLRGLASAAGKITLAAVISSATAWFALRGLESLLLPTNAAGRGGAALALLVAGGVALAVYVGACVLLKVPELRTVRAMFRRAPKAGTPAT
jgi:putative peptidoglycan lipid II flippase